MTSRAAVRRISIDDAAAVLARDGVVVLDVRAPKDFAQGRLPGARHASMADLSDVLGSTPKSAPILIYCYHGDASQAYAQIFTDFRFEEVYSLDGGFEAWSRR